ncbi:hypothetical protein NDU88_000045 [Pleurodeles waltl]|uniref:Uncharacterized protein n=1 Tax=Pleurodeles waltl TaxID=8319 RepID=A0AAV7M486_PLEWA|nr:hypothetical protein NDU88_000045 [Pleurodeles waltl]
MDSPHQVLALCRKVSTRIIDGQSAPGPRMDSQHGALGWTVRIWSCSLQGSQQQDRQWTVSMEPSDGQSESGPALCRAVSSRTVNGQSAWNPRMDNRQRDLEWTVSIGFIDGQSAAGVLFA